MERNVTGYHADLTARVVKRTIRHQFEDDDTGLWVTMKPREIKTVDPITERVALDAERQRYNQLRLDYLDYIAQLDAAVAALGV